MEQDDTLTGAIPNVRTAPCCRAEKIVFLDRRPSGPAELLPLDPEEALNRFVYHRPPWDAPVFDQHRENIHALVSRGVRTLRYSDFDRAIALLESLVS